MSETTTLLKAGATDLVLRMAEAAPCCRTSPWTTRSAPSARSARHNRARRVRLADGHEMSALDIQREYLAKAKGLTASRGVNAVSRRVLGRWRRALDAIGSGNLDAVAREIDWVIEYQLIERYRAEHGVPMSARKSPRPTWPITTSAATMACTTNRSAAARSSGRRVTSISSRRRPSRRPRPLPTGGLIPALASPPAAK